MHAVMRYQIQPDHLATHVELLRAAFAELADEQPEGLAWSAYQLDAEGHFLEVVSGPDLPEPLPRLSAFQTYRADLEGRCVEPPTFVEATQIGAYGFPDG